MVTKREKAVRVTDRLLMIVRHVLLSHQCRANARRIAAATIPMRSARIELLLIAILFMSCSFSGYRVE